MILSKGSRYGFTLIELIVAIAIMGIMAAIALPSLRQRSPNAVRNEFIDHLNGLMNVAWQNAVTRAVEHKVVFDINTKTIHLEAHEGSSNSTARYIPVTNSYIETRYRIPSDTLKFAQFFINGIDYLANQDTAHENKINIFITPEGIAQPAIINCINEPDDENAEVQKFGLVLNPFSAQFVFHEEFQSASLT